jgi:hypothetical protein
MRISARARRGLAEHVKVFGHDLRKRYLLPVAVSDITLVHFLLECGCTGLCRHGLGRLSYSMVGNRTLVNWPAEIHLPDSLWISEK